MEKMPELAACPGSTIWSRIMWRTSWPTCNHQGVFGVFRHPAPPVERGAHRRAHLALERVQDPGNVGTLLRSAAAFGFDGVLLSEGCAQRLRPKTLRASMGAAGAHPGHCRWTMPQALHGCGQRVSPAWLQLCTSPSPLSAAKPGCPGGVCVVIGSEGQGLTDETIAACTSTVRIPMTDRVESLNAGIAGSILLWHFRRRACKRAGQTSSTRLSLRPTRCCAGCGWPMCWARPAPTREGAGRLGAHGSVGSTGPAEFRQAAGPPPSVRQHPAGAGRGAGRPLPGCGGHHSL